MNVRLIIFSLLIGLAACVPAKKYNELVAKEKQSSDELNKYKTAALDYEGKYKDVDARYQSLLKEVDLIKKDTNDLGNKYRVLQTQYDKMVQQNELLETKYDKLRLSGAKESATMQKDLETKNLELQRKEDELENTEKELNAKLKLLAEREQRVTELEELIKRKDDAVTALKSKVAGALKGFENKGLTVVHKNGKIYVSLEAKLLFKTGSTNVEEEGKKALVELAKVLENEKEVEIIVEGHTDTDKMSANVSPKNNWELSVLRSTAVIEIMLNNSKVNPGQLMAAGRSEFHPVDSMDKAKNRRIEIIISPNLDKLFEIINK